jgi:hypothetical protein
MPNNFNDSFNWRVPLRTGRKHGWEHHGKKGTLVRRLLGVLEMWASNDPQHHFIFCSLESLLKQCNKSGDAHSINHLKHVLHEFRLRHIISPYFTAYDGRYGFIMEPHDARARREGSLCIIHHPRDPEYKLHITSQGSPYDAPREHAGGTEGAPREHAGGTPGALTGAPISQNGSTIGGSIGGTDELEQVYKNPELAEAYAQKWLAERGMVGALKLLKSVSREAGKQGSNEAANAETESDQGKDEEQQQEQKPEQGKGNGKSVCLSSSKARLTDQEQEQPQPRDHDKSKATPVQTIGDFFRGDLSILLLTGGELDNGVCRDENERELLEECMAEAVAAKAERPFCGNITCAALMGDTMKLLLETYERTVPTPWLPVMRLLREQTPKEPSPQVVKALEKAKKRPVVNLVPSDFHRANGYERCDDECWRPQVSREEAGFTVKDTYTLTDGKTTYNIWRKAK